MYVWLVWGQHWGDGDSLIGVFVSEDLAKQCKASLDNSPLPHEYESIIVQSELVEGT